MSESPSDVNCFEGKFLETIPKNYKCSECGIHGVKLWKKSQPFNFDESKRLSCCGCICEEIGRDVSDIDKDGCYLSSIGKTDRISSYIPAVPVGEMEDAYWAYTSIPKKGFEWWRKLPNQL